MKTVLITGCAGFVGHHVVEYLLQTTDWKLVCLVRMSRAGDLNRLEEVVTPEYKNRVTVVRHDLLDSMESVHRHIAQVDYILHLAADSHVDDSLRRRKEVFLNNTISTVNMLEYAVKYQDNLSKFIYYSTDEVYGDAKDGYLFKEDEMINPRNPYSAGKASGEMAVNAWAEVTGLPLLITRANNMFGERQDPEKMIPLTINRYLNGLPAIIHEFKGKPGVRTWLHAKNSADALKFCLENKVPYKRVNIGGQVELDNYEISKLIADTMGIEFKHELVEATSVRPGYDRAYGVDPSRLQNLGWKMPIPFIDSLKETIKFSVENPKWVR